MGLRKRKVRRLYEWALRRIFEECCENNVVMPSEEMRKFATDFVLAYMDYRVTEKAGVHTLKRYLYELR